MLERARVIAQAELDLARVRRAKVALIERASAFGEFDPPQLTVTQIIRILRAFDRSGRLIVPKPIDAFLLASLSRRRFFRCLGLGPRQRHAAEVKAVVETAVVPFRASLSRACGQP